MESANSHHHHHQLQDQLVGSSSSSSSSSLTTINPYLYGLGFTSTHHASWPPSSLLNSNCLSSYPNIETKQQQENPSSQQQLYSSNSSMAMGTELSFINYGNGNGNSEEEEECRIKDELAEHYYRKYSEILSSSPSPSPSPSPANLQDHGNDVATKFLLRSLSSYGNYKNNNNNIPADFYSNSRGFAQINFPDPTTTAAGSLDMNLEALDLLASSRFTGNPSHNQIGIFRDGFSNYAFDHHIPFNYASNKVSSASSNAVAEPKRNSNKMEPKSLIQKPPKKSRLEARSSCPPFKVRKEKLGDRIAALQQLVAPFGKTDTASVLMEAIGYIKFLQSQVETLSVPYMKASRNKPNRGTKGGSVENENEETKRDLKSRGLCLVPLSCLSYITDGGGATVWPPPHFGGAT